MAFILPIEEPWTSQPQVVVGIDWSNPLTRNISSIFCNGEVYTPTRTGRHTGSGQSVQNAVTALGLSAIYGTSNASNGSLLNVGELNPVATSSRNNITRLAVVRLLSTDATNRTISSAGTATGDLLWRMTSSTTPAIVANGSAVLLTSTNALSVGEVAVLAMRGIDNGSNTTWSNWKNGIKTNEATSGTAIGGGASPRIGGSVSSASASNGVLAIPLHVEFLSGLSDKEIASISVNPWQIFAP